MGSSVRPATDASFFRRRKMCFFWELTIHDKKTCPDHKLTYVLHTNKDTYEVDTLEELIQVIKQDSGEEK